MMNVNLTQSEGFNDFNTSNDFRRIVLMRNPMIVQQVLNNKASTLDY